MNSTHQSKKSLQTAKEEFEQHDTTLREDIPKLMEQRIDYLQPSLDALIKAQVYTCLSTKLEIHIQDVPVHSKYIKEYHVNSFTKVPVRVQFSSWKIVNCILIWIYGSYIYWYMQ